MAKFILDDGSIKSYDQMVKEYYDNNPIEIIQKEPIIETDTRDSVLSKYEKLQNMPLLKLPGTGTNHQKLINTCMYDILVHIQCYLKQSNECIIEVLTGAIRTGESRKCKYDDCSKCLEEWCNKSNL